MFNSQFNVIKKFSQNTTRKEDEEEKKERLNFHAIFLFVLLVYSKI